METMIKKMMVPIEEYATVSKDATLREAICALEEAQKAFDPTQYKHREIVVMDHNETVVGKITMFDVLIALEPNYETMDDVGGVNPDFLKSLLKESMLWREALEMICDRASNLKVNDFMKVPGGGAYIEHNATLDEAIRQLVMYRFHSLLVIENDNVVGILRLADVFAQVCEKIKRCTV